MELSDPVTPSTNAIDRRKSGRAKQKPILYQQAPNVSIVSNGNGKRKRVETVNIDGDDGDDVDESEEESSIEESDGDPDEEELKEKRRRALKDKAALIKPAAKKPKKTLGAATNLPMRPATNGVKKVSKPRKPRAQQKIKSPVEADEEGLFGEFKELIQAYVLRLTIP